MSHLALLSRSMGRAALRPTPVVSRLRGLSSATQRQASSSPYDSLPVTLFPTREQERALSHRLESAFAFYTKGASAPVANPSFPASEDLSQFFVGDHHGAAQGGMSSFGGHSVFNAGFRVKSVHFDPSKDLVEVQVEVADGMLNKSNPMDFMHIQNMYADSTKRKRIKKMKKHKFKKRRRAQRAMRKKRGLN